MNSILNKLGTSANGIDVYSHPEGHSHRPDLNDEVISKINLPENNAFFRTTVDLGRVIGKDHLVETMPFDTTIMWQRGNRPGKSRMVIKDADDTSFVTAIFCVCREEEGTPTELIGKWILVTLFEGKPGEREPFDHSFDDGKNPEGKAASEAFWASHALVPTETEAEEIIAWAKSRVVELDAYDGDYDDIYYEDRDVHAILKYYGADD